MHEHLILHKIIQIFEPPIRAYFTMRSQTPVRIIHEIIIIKKRPKNQKNQRTEWKYSVASMPEP